MSSYPNCLIIPSSSGSITNCITMSMPSVGTIVLLLIISIILYLVIAYAIYYFLNKAHPLQKVNYWLILLVLIASNIIVGLLAKLF